MNTENAVLALDRIEQKFERLRDRLATVEAERQRLEADLATQKFREEDMVKMLRRARLAAVEAERDAALKRAAEARETADNYAGHCNEACKQLEAVEAERDAAQAGEARAVEALSLIRKELGTIAQGYEEEVRNEFTSGQSHGWGMAYLHAVQIIGGITDGPALAWLSQQRREAAAAALEEFADDAVCMEKLITCNIFDLRSALRTRAAAIRAGEVPHE